ncbi:cyclin-U1-1-like [Malania oleifera]|uniref:cyclin-U1-1-like n=1 Tax=Malania oleifera TaxID=397392 RepID=UPI0025AEB64C|nr:cyclin-U1-1-like [Malania oleifera]
MSDAGGNREDTDSNHLQPEPSEAEAGTPRVLAALSFVLEKLVARNDRLAVDSGASDDDDDNGSSRRLRAFHGARAPNISLAKYVERLYKYCSCSPACLVVGYIYIDRMVHRHPRFLLVSLNVHRLLVTSVMLASKMLDDVHYNNAFYARVGGVSNAELNRLELELLSMLDYGVMVSSRVFESYCLHLEKEMLWNGISQNVPRSPSLPTPVHHIPEIPLHDPQP